MRIIRVPAQAIRQAAYGPISGSVIQAAVCVNWPELQLTETQIIANVMARLDGHPQPFPDHSIFAIELPYVTQGTYNR